MRNYDSLFSNLLSDLGLEAVDATVGYNSDNSTHFVSRLALANSFYKKLCPEGNSADADLAALKKFEAINISISTAPFDFKAQSEAESCFWDYFRNEVASATDQRAFGQSFDLDFIRDHMGVGPGAAQKANSACMVTKLFAGPVSYTNPELIDLYRAALAGTGIWAEAEMLRFNSFGFVRVKGDKVFFAPKNREISRTCCTPPLLNQLIQMAIGAFLEQALERDFDINLSTQPDLNRELARLGSLEWETRNGFCTTDLVSASDCMALSLIDAVIVNPVLKRAMMISRSELATLPSGKMMRLNMVSTMGNGFTFPLQTLLFACAVKAVYQLMGIPLSCRGSKNYAVFGDDIIVRKDAYDFLNRMLGKLGFTVNVQKSYSNGPFRESCGHDYFAGRNVRGVYVVSLESPQEVVSVINRLNRWSAYHSIELPRTIAQLWAWAPRKSVLVPPSENDDAGVHVPFKLTKPRLTAAYWFKYRAFKRVSAKVDVEEDPGCEAQVDFEAGLRPAIAWLSDGKIGFGFLSGTYRRRDVSFSTEEQKSEWSKDCGWNVALTLREMPGVRPRYKVVTKAIPFWDYLPLTKIAENPEGDGPWRLGRDPESYSRWETIVAAGMPGRACLGAAPTHDK